MISIISSKEKASFVYRCKLASSLKACCNISLFIFINSENSSGFSFRAIYIFSFEVITLKIDSIDRNKALLTIDDDSLLSYAVSYFISPVIMTFLIKSNKSSIIVFNFENICNIVVISSE